MMDLSLLHRELSCQFHLTHLDVELLRDILRYLHRIGLIVWYEEVKQLESTVFLCPDILITIFKVSARCPWLLPHQRRNVDSLKLARRGMKMEVPHKRVAFIYLFTMSQQKVF